MSRSPFVKLFWAASVLLVFAHCARTPGTGLKTPADSQPPAGMQATMAVQPGPGDPGGAASDSPEAQDRLADIERQRAEAADAEQRRGTPSDPNVLRDALAVFPIVNLSSRRVNLFIGLRPGGPGVVTVVEAKGTLTKRMQIHSKVWILDEKGDPISSVIIESESPEITINPSGNGFR